MNTSLNPNALMNTMGTGYLSWFSQFFRYYRGSLKFRFVFVTNAFTSARFRISFGYGPQSGMALTTYNASIPTTIVTVKGMVVHDMTIPLVTIYDKVGMSAVWLSAVPEIILNLEESISSSGDRAATAQVYIFWAADSDFELIELLEPGYIEPYVTPVNMEGQMDMWREFEKPFPLAPGTVKPKQRIGSSQPQSVEDLMTRWSLAFSKTPETNQTWSTGYSMANDTSQISDSYPRVLHPWYLSGVINDTNIFDNIGILFMWNAGNMSWKISLSPDYTLTTDQLCVGKITTSILDPTVRLYPDAVHPDSGTVNIDPSQWKVIDFTTPFQSAIAWDTWVSDNRTTIKKYNTVQEYGQSWDAAPQTIWKKAGNDFVLNQLLPLPDSAFWATYIHYVEISEAQRSAAKPKITPKIRKSRTGVVTSTLGITGEEQRPVSGKQTTTSCSRPLRK